MEKEYWCFKCGYEGIRISDVCPKCGGGQMVYVMENKEDKG